MNRLLALLKREWKTGQKDYSTYGLVIVLLLFAFETMQSLVARYTGSSFPMEVYSEMFPGFLLLGGFITTSMLFSEDMFSKNAQHNWLMLPATNLEKFLSKALVSTIGYPIALTLLFFLTSVVTEPIQLLIFGSPIGLFNPFRDNELWSLLAQYWVWNSVFLLGATFFHKGHFIKTVLAVGVVFLGLGSLALLFTRIVFAIKFGSSMQMFDSFMYFDSRYLQDSLTALKVFSGIASVLYYAVLPLFCLVTAYFRVEEVQATDAV